MFKSSYWWERSGLGQGGREGGKEGEKGESMSGEVQERTAGGSYRVGRPQGEKGGMDGGGKWEGNEGRTDGGKRGWERNREGPIETEKGASKDRWGKVGYGESGRREKEG